MKTETRLALALVGILMSCAKPLASKPSNTIAPDIAAKIPVESYFPLTEKSRWTYRVQDFVKKLTYLSKVRVHGPEFVDTLKRDGIGVEERYSSFGPNGPFILEEQEPILYFHESGYLNRMLLTYQAGKVVPASGSGDTQFLPEVLTNGASWDSNTQAFRVGDLGFKVSFRHTVAIDRETVTVPAGTFKDCVRVDTSSTEGANSGYGPGEELVFYYADWYAAGVGLVLTRQWDDAGHERERTRIELMEYSVAPSPGQPPTARN
jgi:hypothetical protein